MQPIPELQQRLIARASAPRREWWERYLRGNAAFRGVAMDDVRTEVHEWYAAHGLHALDPMAQAELALDLIRERHTEDKLSGMLLFQEILIPSGEPGYAALFPKFVTLFEDNHLSDWNSVDWFCVRVLGPLVARDGAPCGTALGAWRAGSTLWQRRASAVGFVNLVPHGERFPGFQDLVMASCEVLVHDPARFSQTGAGWVLRELSRAAPERVEAFVRTHAHRMSREAFRSAVKKLPKGAGIALPDPSCA